MSTDNNLPVIKNMMGKKESFSLLAETFSIPVAKEGETGTKVLLYYQQGKPCEGSFNGGQPLEDKHPWSMVAPIIRYVYLRGMKGEFALKLLYTGEGYKLEKFVFF